MQAAIQQLPHLTLLEGCADLDGRTSLSLCFIFIKYVLTKIYYSG